MIQEWAAVSRGARATMAAFISLGAEGRSIVLAGVLFDLDGTLLEIDLDAFLRDYFAALGPVVAEVMGTGASVEVALQAVMTSTEAMTLPHADTTNREAFNATFRRLTGTDLDLDEYALPFERFYAEVFPTLRGKMVPRAGAREAVETALSLGLKVAIATNPIFPLSAIRERMRWAHIEDLHVQVITSYETMHATKPLSGYYSQTADMLGVDPRNCLMVGDDRTLDMAAADVGMRTFYVGNAPIPTADYSGSTADVASLIERLVSI